MVPDGLEPNWQTYQISLGCEEAPLSRNEVMERCVFDLGVPTRRGVMASHPRGALSRHIREGDLPITEAVAAATLQLPMHPALTARATGPGGRGIVGARPVKVWLAAPPRVETFNAA